MGKSSRRLLLQNQDSRKLKSFEKLISNGHSTNVWNRIRIEGVRDIEENYSEDRYKRYPLLADLISKRVEAYKKVEDGFYRSASFSTARLLLCQCDESSEDALVAAATNDEDFHFFDTNNRGARRLFEEAVNGLNCYVAKRGNELIGFAFINTIELEDGWTLGYYIVPSERRKGYAKEIALSLICRVKSREIFDLALTDMKDVYEKVSDCRRLVAFSSKDNEASINLLTSIGFKLKGEEGAEYRYELDISE